VQGAATFPISGVSPDDALLATPVTIAESSNTYKRRIGLFKTNSLDAPPEVIDAGTRIVMGMRAPLFTPDGLALVYAIRGENNEYNLWLQPRDGQPGRQVTHFPSEQIYGFSWSPDGKKLLGRGHIESDVVLLRDTSK
jgi:dipeptidyl aminopeptidase/acylaminoacyl peptidase